MTDQELLQAMSEMMDKKLEPIKADIAEMKEDVAELKEDVAELKEDAEITRSGVNTLLAWAEDCGNVIKFPLPKIAEGK